MPPVRTLMQARATKKLRHNLRTVGDEIMFHALFGKGFLNTKIKAERAMVVHSTRIEEPTGSKVIPQAWCNGLIS